nr:hypothetical protein [Morchella crassipes]
MGGGFMGGGGCPCILSRGVGGGVFEKEKKEQGRRWWGGGVRGAAPPLSWPQGPWERGGLMEGEDGLLWKLERGFAIFTAPVPPTQWWGGGCKGGEGGGGRGGEAAIKIIKWSLPRPPSTPRITCREGGGKRGGEGGGHFNHKMTTPPPPPPSFILIFSPALPYHNLDYENNPCLKGKGDSEKTCLF